MGALKVKIYLGVDDLPKSEIVTLKSGKKALFLEAWIDDEKHPEWKNNGGVSVQQSKEAREAKEKRIYVGNITAEYNKDFDPVQATKDPSAEEGEAVPGDDLMSLLDG